MSRILMIGLVLLSLVLGGACSDDGDTPDAGKPADKTVADKKPADTGKDAPADQGADAPADSSVDSSVKEGGGQEGGGQEGGGQEASAKDQLSDKKKPVKDAASLAIVEGYISRSVLPLNDGKGDIHVGVTQWLIPFPMATAVVSHADLSKPGAKVKYQITSSMTMLKGDYEVSAWMDDNNNAWSPLPLAQTGDLTTSKGTKVTFSGTTTGPQKVDLVLDKVVQLTTGDAGMGTALRGKISTTTGPSVDGKGNIIIALYSKLPPSGLVTVEALGGADLSSTFATEAYYLSGVKAGNYYLRIFMDDNTNANLGAPTPDKGDMVHSKAIQVHLVSGQVNVQDVVFDALKK